MRETTDATFHADVLASPLPVLVLFSAPWCKPCLALLPHLDKVAEEYAGKMEVVKHNCEQHPGIPAQYFIMSLPTVYLFVGGRAVDARRGSLTPAKLRSMLERNGVTA